jgi:hypothetical protein
MSTNEIIVIDTPEGIAMYRMLALKHALHMETMGMCRRGQSVYSIVKQEYNLKGNKQKVYEKFCEIVESAKADRSEHNFKASLA